MRGKREQPRPTTPELWDDPSAEPAGAPSWALPFDAAHPPSVQLLRHGRYRDLRGVFAAVRLHGAGSTVEAHPPPPATPPGRPTRVHASGGGLWRAVRAADLEVPGERAPRPTRTGGQ